jgi:hypothetical protein
VCFDILYKFYPKHFLLQEELREILLKIFIGLNVKYPVFLIEFYETWIFTTNFRKKNTQISNLVKIRPVGTELFHAGGQIDGQTDIKKLIATYRNFANAPKHVPLKYYPSNCSSGTRDRTDSCGNHNNFWGVKIGAI